MTLDLFTELSTEQTPPESFAPGAVLLRAFALKDEKAILAAIQDVAAAAPFRQMETPGGFRMSAAMSNCGALGWVTDRGGYRYTARDPRSGRDWPAMPAIFHTLAQSAAAQAGFARFEPDACLVNRYEPGTRLTLHQDRNEKDFAQPIVSVSLGIPAVFLFGGLKRADRCARLRLLHGDVVVWGGPARLRFHGVMPLAPAVHPQLGAQRINLTLRKAG